MSASPDLDLAIRPASAPDAAAVAAIYNVGIQERGSTFEIVLRSEADMARRITENPRQPVIVATRGDRIVGWASISGYRPRDCYAGVGEFSVYIAPDVRGQGIGKRLVDALIDEARRLGYWKLLSRIFTFNTASLALCRACGFREVGVYEKHGQLDGRWLDVVIVERLIPENQ